MRIVSVTTGRADVGHLEPVWREIHKREGWGLNILVLGSHQLSGEWDVFPRFPFDCYEGDDSPVGIGRAIAKATRSAAGAYAHWEPDLILVVGDRWEALAAVSAALPFGIPVAHIGGGDETTGSYDNQMRHAITKLAHLHFVAHEQAKVRVLAIGEEPWRVHLTGLPSIDGIREWQEGLKESPELGEELVVIFHSPTLELDTAEEQARELGKALAQIGRPIKGFVPGHDVLHQKVHRALIGQLGAVENQWLEQETPVEFYRTLSRAACMVGNSSAGIIEACSFGLPVVDIGSRQQGRVRPANVLHAQAGCGKLYSEYGNIVAAIERALSAEFRASCQGLVNPYGDGHAAERIVAVLADLPRSVRGTEASWKKNLLKKRRPYASAARGPLRQ